jgi:multicomponent Na+:H+ antiporter subunit B
MTHHFILRIITKLLIPLILLFALYVQFHGDFGPGGGFQAGVIFAAGLVLYALVFGLDTASEVIKEWVLLLLAPLGVLIYAGVGLASLYFGGTYLNYSVLAHDPVHGQHLGILLVELGVGVTVASVLTTIFFSFAGRRKHDATAALKKPLGDSNADQPS